MIIAAAQKTLLNNDADSSIEAHCRMIELAAQHAAKVIVFPEMSLTGYSREFADVLSFSENDTRIDRLRKLAELHNILIIVGAPIRIGRQLHIGSFICLPDSTLSIYTKQFLHPGEELFFTPNFDFNPIIELDGERLSFAICADIANPLHPESASLNGVTLYLASLYYTPNGIHEAYKQLSDYAEKNSMNILMANYVGTSASFDAAGRSAFWNKNGELIGQLDERTEGLLLVEFGNNVWTAMDLHLS